MSIYPVRMGRFKSLPCTTLGSGPAHSNGVYSLYPTANEQNESIHLCIDSTRKSPVRSRFIL
jgi:hypothetical protein